MGGVKPNMYDLKSYFGYDIQKLGDRAVFWHVIKNRELGQLGVIPLFRAESPGFYELPPPDKIDYNQWKI